MGSLFDVYVQFNIVGETTFHFHAYAESDQRGQRAMGHCGVEFDANLS